MKTRARSERAEKPTDKSSGLILTARERDVLACLLSGDANKDIALRLGCSVRTVEFHVSSLLRKAGCANRLQLVTHPLVAPGRSQD